ncbi:MAG TPA: thiamine pyrophosphate-binding protein [Gemmataceae bacterium]|nr:thiamine pyrophosphate-binding protein [Gemmataceae bacterium]
MFDGPSVVKALQECGITHVIWLPDSAIGAWEKALTTAPGLTLVRVCREGEAFALAAGLYLGGKKPIVFLQCTGLFEAGDSLRNVVYDMKLPIFFLAGVRNYYAHQEGKTLDSCPVFTEPIMQAWKIQYKLLDEKNTPADMVAAYRQAQAENRPGAVLLAERDL